MTFDNMEVKPADMFRLCPAVFLNDTTINLYIKIISNHILDQQRAGDFHFFNTYFFSKLRQEVSNSSAQNDLALIPKNRQKLQDTMDPIHKRIKKVGSG